MKNIIAFFFIVVCIKTAASQIDTLQHLPEVVVTDVKLRANSTGLKVQVITDSVILRSRTSLTEILRSNTLLYFKENGPGGVSSVSLRGTNAQQTAVVWNGININSFLTGQTDFNTVSSKNLDNILVRPGGGSIIYGSGAVGGSVHLENKMTFDSGIKTKVTAGYGSYNTQVAAARTRLSREKIYLDVGIDYQSSDNEFKYPDTEIYNENGEFENIDISLNAGLKIPSSGIAMNTVKFHHNSYLGNRNFSGTLTAPSNDGYQDRNTRTLITAEQKLTNYRGMFKVAHIFEQFKYYGNTQAKEQYDLGKVNRLLTGYDAEFKIDNSKKLSVLGALNSIKASGNSIATATRFIGGAVALWQHQLSRKLTYEVQARQEMVSDFKSPFLMGIGLDYAFAKAENLPLYTISFNASRNYRIPTFNDQYWEGAGAVGNPDLVPETSVQAEIGHKIALKNLTFDLRKFYINSENLIKWQPNNNGVWSPINIQETENYGVEFTASLFKNYGQHSFKTVFQYGFTVAENLDTEEQLIYVPKHTGNFNFTYDYKWLNIFAQNNYYGFIYTTSDNTAKVPAYYLTNLGVTGKFLNTSKNKMSITGMINNLFNTNYQTVAFRPNPGRNFLIQTTYTF